MVKALIIDDSSTVRRIIAEMLKSLEIASVQAEHGADGLEVLKCNHDVSIVFVDWNMPVMSGIEFVRRVRSEQCYQHLKIIMVTTETDMHRIVQAIEYGIDEYIMKPFTKEMFVEKLEMVGVKGSDASVQVGEA